MRHILLLALLFCITTTVVAWSQTPLSFIPISSCRVADTRNPAMPAGFGPPSLAAASKRTFIIPDNHNCPVPDTTLAYSLNVTVVPNGNYLGYLTIFPDDQQQPVVSTLNSYDGLTKANAVIVGAGADGGVSIFVPDETNVVLDIAGYWVGPSNPATGKLQYFSIPGVNVCNLVNTQNATGPLGGPALSGGTARSFPVQSGSCGIPPTALAYSLNVTAVPINGAPVSWVTVWPSTQTQPGTSTLNAPTGTTVENAALVPTGGGSGAISVFSPDDTNIIIDINGYFAPAVPGTSLTLYTTTPCRILDTRSTSGPFTGQIDVLVQPVLGGGTCNLPAFSAVGPEAYVLNATALPENGAALGYLPVWPTGLALPLPSTLVALDGAVTSNMAITFSLPPYAGYVSAFASISTNLLLDISGYFSSDVLTITTTSIPAGNQFTPYAAFNMGAQGGIPPYSWTGTGFPAGLSISTTGVISATCVTGMTSTSTISVTDSASPPDTVTATFPITINPYVTISFVTTPLLPAGTLGSPYGPVQIVVTNGVPPYTFTLVPGMGFSTLPNGLVLSSTGIISGTPLGTDPVGTYKFVVQVVDSSCDNPAPGNTITGTFSITIT